MTATKDFNEAKDMVKQVMKVVILVDEDMDVDAIMDKDEKVTDMVSWLLIIIIPKKNGLLYCTQTKAKSYRYKKARSKKLLHYQWLLLLPLSTKEQVKFLVWQVLQVTMLQEIMQVTNLDARVI